ncbi:MAG: hypothetical protein GX062_07315 [Firmicutes bacterium]|nr:hypothetical protein [Bacillota bacterium]
MGLLWDLAQSEQIADLEKAVDKLTDRVDVLEKENLELKEQIKALQAVLEELQAKACGDR